MNPIIIQAVGFICTICYLASYQIKNSKTLILVQMSGSVAMVIQYILLGAFGGSITVFATVIRFFMVYISDKHPALKKKYWQYIWIVIFAVIAGFTWEGWTSILPFIAVVGSTLAVYSFNAKKIRLFNLTMNSPAWLIYDIIYNSWGGITTEVLTILSILISIKRYGLKNLGNENM